MSAISVDSISKRYLIGHQVKHDTLRDSFTHGLKNMWHTIRSGQLEQEEFWALRDVSFTVEPGEVMGIIGRNGAGKSTLLKVLSRITEPTTGNIQLRGRVASLLEVGTGFHPELSGRENIFLNGAILGMTRAEIRRKFDEIVSFAEVERFLDTPVKRYSSGMYVRLAFAVAAHLEPEILIVDEVLAVGDAAFRQKCMGKMQDVASEGRTVLFVSHDIGAIAGLTTRCVLLHEGRIVTIGDTDTVVARYLESHEASTAIYETPDPTNVAPHISRISIQTSEGQGLQAAGKPMSLRFEIAHHHGGIKGACLSFQIINQSRQPATHAWLSDQDMAYARSAGSSTLRCLLPTTRLNVGHYSLNAYLSEPPGGEVFDKLESVCPFEVVRLEEPPLWGWRAEACAYHEDNTWEVLDSASTIPN